MVMKAVTLTHVRYEKGDHLGLVMAWASLLPVFIAFGGFTTHILFRRELQTIFFCAGMGLSEIINQVIKKTVQEARPFTCEILEACDSHGWPSSHSQYMCFFSIYISLLVFRRCSFVNRSSALFCGLVSWPFAVLVMWSRIYLGYHSLPQVIAGASIGLSLGACWFFTVNRYLVKWFPTIEALPLCRYLLLKDGSHIPNVLLFEYKNSLAARKTSKKKRNS